jgi:methylamine dehydrogenase accessory protein MauD
MNFWVVSYVVLWILVLFQFLALISLYRHVGLIHMRFGPRGALAMAGEGPPVGERIPEPVFTDIEGVEHALTDGLHDRMLIYLSASCVTCQQLLPGIRTLSRESDAQIVILTLESSAPYESVLSGFPIVRADELARRHLVYNTPFAIGVDSHGTVVSKGIVNTLEHLEDLEKAFSTRNSGVEAAVASEAAAADTYSQRQ